MWSNLKRPHLIYYSYEVRFLIDILNNLSGAELVALSSILAIIISEGLNNDEINTLGDFLSALGENLSTIASANGDC